MQWTASNAAPSSSPLPSHPIPSPPDGASADFPAVTAAAGGAGAGAVDGAAGAEEGQTGGRCRRLRREPQTRYCMMGCCPPLPLPPPPAAAPEPAKEPPPPPPTFTSPCSSALLHPCWSQLTPSCPPPAQLAHLQRRTLTWRSLRTSWGLSQMTSSCSTSEGKSDIGLPRTTDATGGAISQQEQRLIDRASKAVSLHPGTATCYSR